MYVYIYIYIYACTYFIVLYVCSTDASRARSIAETCGEGESAQELNRQTYDRKTRQSPEQKTERILETEQKTERILAREIP